MRLEENILVTKGKPVNLSKNVAPREKTPIARDTDFCIFQPSLENVIQEFLSQYTRFKTYN